MQDIINDYFRIAGRLPLDTQVTDAADEAVTLGEGIGRTIEAVTAAHDAGNTLRFIGNGGSAGIASHMAVDFAKRGGIRAEALNDPAMLTCLANDLGYDQVFAHQLALHARAGDVLVAISSSGQSENILAACRIALDRGTELYTFSGFDAGNPLRDLGTLNYFVPSSEYGFVELCHMALLSATIDVLIGWRPNTTED